VESSPYPQRSMDEVEELADEFNLHYFRTAGHSLTLPIPVEDMAEHHLGYSIYLRDDGLFADPEFLGGIDFDQNEIYVNASIEDHDGRYSFTVAHEIGHHVLHREVYLEINQIGDKQILCRDTKEKPHIEVEADRFAAALLMPSDAIRSAIAVIKPKRKVRTIGQARGLANDLIKEGRFTNVSNTAMINRLIDLSIISKSVGYQDGQYNRRRGSPSISWLINRAFTKIRFWS
jgi:Zn-dependent peptidase ImmA (M78 family)